MISFCINIVSFIFMMVSLVLFLKAKKILDEVRVLIKIQCFFSGDRCLNRVRKKISHITNEDIGDALTEDNRKDGFHKDEDVGYTNHG